MLYLKIKRAYRRPKSEISSLGFRRYALWFINYRKDSDFMEKCKENAPPLGRAWYI